MQLPRVRISKWIAILGSIGAMQCGSPEKEQAKDPCISHYVNPRQQTLRLFWQDDKGGKLRSIQRLRDWLAARHQRLVFAANGGMYKAGNIPLGLFIENGVTQTPLDTTSGTGNFYLKPNGVFFLTADRKAGITPTTSFRFSTRIRYATQSGPLLVYNGQIHPAFNAHSTNLNIRNGVGILPDGRVLFAMSKASISLYDFAVYFQQRGCHNALYLDGFVSRTYLPEKQWTQLDGDFGVMVGVTEPAE